MKIDIVNCFDTYEQRVDLLYQYFSSRGNDVTVLSSDFRHIEKVRRTVPKEGYIFFTAEPYRKNLSLARMSSHVHLSQKIFSYVEEHSSNLDLLWVLIPPNTFVKDAARVKANHPSIKLVFDVIDMWPETMPINNRLKNIYPIRSWGEIRDKHINAADLVVTECNLYQDRLIHFVNNEKLTTLYLARNISTLNSNPSPSENDIELCYLGSINNIIDISEIGKTISNFRKEKPVILHVIGDGEKKTELLNTAKASGAQVIDHGKIYDRQQKQKIFDSCHFGLNLYKKDVYIGLTMKSIDYFEAGLPIINNIKGDTWNLVEKYDAGINQTANDDGTFSYDIQMRDNARKIFIDQFSHQAFETSVDSACNTIFHQS